MSTPEFKIKDIIETDAFGQVEVMDLFRSTTNPDWYCYRVETTEPTRESFLAGEEDLLT